MKALMLIGSPKGTASASAVLASALGDALVGHGVDVSQAVVGKEPSAVLEAVEGADLVVLAFPLYVDSLPAPVTRLLELIAERDLGRGKRLAAIVQCGFPEASQCETALDICRVFTRTAGMSWAGGLAMGMGGSLGGGLDKVPPRAARNVREAMRQAAEAMANGTAVSAEAARLLAEPLMPRWLYLLAGNAGWRWQLRQNRAKRPIAFRPYPQD